MYHPVLENDVVDNHEFIEIHNTASAAVDLSGFSLSGDVAFTFAPNTKITPGQYLVIAKNRKALAAVKKYGVAENAILGDYSGELPNGKGRVSLLDVKGDLVDAIAYSDQFPWPVSADAMGAGAAWLRPELLPLEKFQYLGRSLERYSFKVPTQEKSNWGVSPPDGATPGKANSLSGDPPPIVEELAARVSGKVDKVVRATEPVIVNATFSARGTVKTPHVEYFVDDVIQGTAPAKAQVGMQAMMTGADAMRTATLPGQKDESIVRYRILGDRGMGKGMEVLSPRPTDPYDWHAYFVTPMPKSKARVFHVYVSVKNWTTMWDNIEMGRSGCGIDSDDATCARCETNPKWNARVPAVLVVDGEVYDVSVRYEGSNIGRNDGVAFGAWTFSKPTRGPFQAWSWSLAFRS
jgi:hypothetical protein